MVRVSSTASLVKVHLKSLKCSVAERSRMVVRNYFTIPSHLPRKNAGEKGPLGSILRRIYENRRIIHTKKKKMLIVRAQK